ncbi:MAG: 5'/3'-nucleotidase SurE [Paludibacteraceae bacterium]|nr:5'/3'-nucleotidase SurE [Paludibacteraceae bacterium]
MDNNRPIILITNDDGYEANGITQLTEVARQHGKVVIVAPEQQQSGKSCAITHSVPLRMRLVSESDDITIYACNGTPVDCVKLSLYTLFRERRPDLVISGINHGSNASVNAVYSGTVGAAVEGCVNKISSIAFSSLQYDKKLDLDNVLPIISQIIGDVVKTPLPLGTLLNVNFPVGEVKEVRFCRQANARWSEEYVPHDTDSFLLAGEFYNREPDAEDTDEWALSHHMASVVPLLVDRTDYNYLHKLNYKYGR